MNQIVRVTEVNSLAEYVEKQDLIKIERPRQCVNAKCGRSNGFWRHPGYCRTAREGELSVVVSIERFLCKYCGAVVSCLFDFLIPYVTFTVKAVGSVVQGYAGRKVSYRELAQEEAVETAQERLRPSHTQIFRWTQRMASQAGKLLLHVQRAVIGTNRELLAERELFCANSWKAFTAKKRMELDDLVRLLVQSSVFCGGGELTVVEWLHRYFSQTSAMSRAILSGRQMKLSAQQRAQHMNF